MSAPISQTASSTPCCSCSTVSKVILLITGVALLAIGIGGLAKWDFHGLGRLSSNLSWGLAAGGALVITIALLLLCRGSSPKKTQSDTQKAQNEAPKKADSTVTVHKSLNVLSVDGNYTERFIMCDQNNGRAYFPMSKQVGSQGKQREPDLSLPLAPKTEIAQSKRGYYMAAAIFDKNKVDNTYAEISGKDLQNLRKYYLELQTTYQNETKIYGKYFFFAVTDVATQLPAGAIFVPDSKRDEVGLPPLP